MLAAMDLAQARALRDAQIKRRGAPPPPPVVRSPSDAWRPSPLSFEVDRACLRALPLAGQKVWDLSPVDPASFDPSQPPDLTDPPANTVLPQLSVGSVLVGTTGSWSNTPTLYARQWYRDGAPILGATVITYTLAAIDVGRRIGFGVVAYNSSGSTSADAVPVGPVTAASR